MKILNGTPNGDELTVTEADGEFRWNAGAGADILTLNYKAMTTATTTVFVDGHYVITGAFGTSEAYDVEKLVFQGGAGDDIVTSMSASDEINGGAGIDSIIINRETDTAGLYFNSAHKLLSDDTKIAKIEILKELRTGSGNDTADVEGNDLNFTWYAGGGKDQLNLAFISQTVAFTAVMVDGCYQVTSSLGTIRVYDIEGVAFKAGKGNDNISSSLAGDRIYGGGGLDTVNIDRSSSVAGVTLGALRFDGASLFGDGVYMSDGSFFSGIENLESFKTGKGDDRLDIGADGCNLRWEAGAGTDSLYVSYVTSVAITALKVDGHYEISSALGTARAFDIEYVHVTGSKYGDSLTGLSGSDWLAGGKGDDTYFVSSTGNEINDFKGEGNDTVVSSVSYTLGDGVTVFGGTLYYLEIENLTLTGSADINGTGNKLANVLTGNSGKNKLLGGQGDDTYYVGGSEDIVTELLGEGNDIIFAANTYVMATGTEVETLTLTGEANIDATGSRWANTLNGNAGNNRLDGGAGADTLIGRGGNDTYYLDDAADKVLENAGEGVDIIITSVAFDLSATPEVENLTLAGVGNINGTGNDFANLITGNSGNNQLDGKDGADTMSGGLGNDTYYVDTAADLALETKDQGTDTVIAAASYALGVKSYVENLILTGEANLNATGNGIANSLTGNAGNNALDGGAGADTLSGGLGNDTYIVDNSADLTVEAAGAGMDTVLSSVSYALQASSNIETLVLTGTANINATGDNLANTLTGNAGNNRLDGKGGADTLSGGLGNDTYYVDDAADLALEAKDQGTDMVYASVSYALGAKSYVETLTLAGTGNIDGTGNAIINRLNGNSGNNLLDGKGGADTLVGGLGDDTYIVDDSADLALENKDQGTDTVLASVNYALGAKSYVENLTLTGRADINATGNNIANVLTGNAGVNILTGNAGNDVLNGKAGADTLIGGTDNDTYYVDNALDLAVEIKGEGTDTVFASASYVLGASSYVENLTLTGSADLNGTGNNIANVLTGNAGVNILTGNKGDDIYYVQNAADQAIEVKDQGTDTVISSVTFVLGATSYVENLTLTGSADLNGTGNNIANVLTGNSGANILSGLKGDDTLTGGLGADTFVFAAKTGKDTISDFSAVQNDRIDISAITKGTANAALISQHDGDTWIDLGSGNIVVIANTVATDAALLSHIIW